MIKDIKEVISAVTEAIVTTARTTNKAVHLVENEVDNLEGYQKIRLEQNDNELAIMRVEFEKAKKAALRKPRVKKVA